MNKIKHISKTVMFYCRMPNIFVCYFEL